LSFVRGVVHEVYCTSDSHPPHHRNARHIQDVLGRQDHARQPDGNPRKLARLRNGHSQRRRHSGVVRRINHQLRGCVRRHPRVGQNPRLDDRGAADPTAGDATVLHGPPITAPPHHLRATAASTRWPRIRPAYPVNWRQRRQRISRRWRISSRNDDGTTINQPPDAIQAP
jgi:hypothetical protein